MKMQCADAEQLLVDYLDKQLPASMVLQLEEHLAACPKCSAELAQYRELFHAIDSKSLETPSPMLAEKFSTMLQSEINILETERIVKPETEKKSRVISLPGIMLRVAACLLLVASGAALATFLNGSKNTATTEMAQMRQELKTVKESMMFAMLDAESASDRIKAVTYAEQMPNPDSVVINALIRTINEDQNVNVRLAALNSVSKFSSLTGVRDALVNSLFTQKEPIVQIVLIKMLADTKEPKARAPIRKIISDTNTLAPVKDAAIKGLKQL